MKIKYFLFIICLFILAACEEDSVPAGNNESSETEISVSFRNLDVQTEASSFMLTGEVNADENVFYYTVKQGENELLSEQSIDISEEAAGWSEFEITGEIPEEALQEEETPIITLYGKDAAGEEINPNYIPIDVGIR